MKWIKYICSILIFICLCCFVLGCDWATDLPLQNESDTTNGGDESQLYIEGIEEYNDYVASTTKPDTFVSYEMLSDIGEMELFIPCSEHGIVCHYSYSLVTGNGLRIGISVSHGDMCLLGNCAEEVFLGCDSDYKNTDSDIYLPFPPTQGFANTNEFNKQIVSYNGIRYAYADGGELVGMEVVLDDIRITVYPRMNCKFSQLVFERENLITCLLSGNEDNEDIISRYLTETKQED